MSEFCRGTPRGQSPPLPASGALNVGRRKRAARKPPTPVSPRTSSRPSSSGSSGWRKKKKTISEDIRDVYADSKANGFDVKALRAVDPAAQAGSRQERNEQQLILETYMNALGMLAA